MIDNKIVRVRFPNESFYDKITNFEWNEFKPSKYFSECVFGWYNKTYIAVNREDYDNRKNNR